MRGRDPVEDLNTSADAIAESPAELFNWNGGLVWINAGKLVPVAKDALIQIIEKHVAVRKLVNRGATDAPAWECEVHHPHGRRKNPPAAKAVQSEAFKKLAELDRYFHGEEER